jgi:hypothetical protein
MKQLVIIGLLLVLLAGCGSAGTTSQTGSIGDTAAEAEPAAAEEAPEAAGAPAAEGAFDRDVAEIASRAAVQSPQTQRERIVIRTATLQLDVERVDSAEAQVRQIAESRGGYVLSSQTYGEAGERFATITIKVPAIRFDQTISDIGRLALEVKSQEVQGEDVTDEYVDLESRLRNLRAVEARLQQFLERAETIEEALEVNRQLADIQGQIEQTQGRISYLQQSAALSTITVSMRSQVAVEVTPPTTWSPVAVARTALRSLLTFGQSLATVAIVLGVWSPVWLPFVIAGVWMWRRSRGSVVGSAS